MAEASRAVALSPLDENRFGVRTARAMRLRHADLPEVMEFCDRERVGLLIARCSTSDLPAVQAMEQLGCSLMDTLVYFRRSLENLPPRRDVHIRKAKASDVEAIREIAQQAFPGYDGHYHADTRLDRALCDDLYVDWATRSCTQPGVADEVLLAEIDGAPVGFLTLKVVEKNHSDGLLYAVVPRAQGRGVGQALLIEALHWSRERDLSGMIISTQITNLASQISWVRVGFAPWQSHYTFHKWFDNRGL